MLSTKLSLKDITVYFSAIYFISLVIGGVIFYQYFTAIHYLPIIEVSMIFGVILFVFGSGFLITITSFIVVLIPGLSFYVIDNHLAPHSKVQDELRNFMAQNNTHKLILLFTPWLIWTAYYAVYYRQYFEGILAVLIFIILSIVGGFCFKFLLPNSIKKYWCLFILYVVAVGLVQHLDYKVSSFLYGEPLINLPGDNKVDIFLMSLAVLYASTLRLSPQQRKYMITLTTFMIMGTVFFLINWTSPQGNTLSKAIMTNFKLGYTDVSLELNKDYMDTIKQNLLVSGFGLNNNIWTGRLLSRLGSEYVVEIKTCSVCHKTMANNILCIPKDKVESLLLLQEN